MTRLRQYLEAWLARAESACEVPNGWPINAETERAAAKQALAELDAIEPKPDLRDPNL